MVELEPDERLTLSLTEVAQRIGIGRTLMYDLIAAGRIETVSTSAARTASASRNSSRSWIGRLRVSAGRSRQASSPARVLRWLLTRRRRRSAASPEATRADPLAPDRYHPRRASLCTSPPQGTPCRS
jgi:hypothetical protein